MYHFLVKVQISKIMWFRGKVKRRSVPKILYTITHGRPPEVNDLSKQTSLLNDANRTKYLILIVINCICNDSTRTAITNVSYKTGDRLVLTIETLVIREGIRLSEQHGISKIIMKSDYQLAIQNQILQNLLLIQLKTVRKQVIVLPGL